MKTACSSVSGYPWKTDEACLNRCDTYSDPQLKCFPYWCEKAQTGPAANKKHTCEHAWGMLGLSECP